MEAAAFETLRDTQTEHWWFRGRRKVVESVIAANTSLPANPEILEAGCGYGGNLEMLSRFGNVQAFEYDESARAFSATNFTGPVVSGRLPDRIGFDQKAFDLIALLDVLEHVEEDIEALAVLRERLAPQGMIVLTVPALQWLWSEHDVMHQHHRRYSYRSLAGCIRDAGLSPVRMGYFNTLLFPLALAQRLAARFGIAENADKGVPSEPLNSALARIFSTESSLVNRVRMPIGLSLFAVAKRQN